MEILKEIKSIKKKEPIYVFGHKNADIDTITSIYLLKQILNKRNVIGLIHEKYNNLPESSKLFMKQFDIVSDFIYNQILSKDDYFIMVDHNDIFESVGIEEYKPVYVLDHHKQKREILKGIIDPYSSCALLIYDKFKDFYNFSDKEKEMILLSTLVDTVFLASSKFRKSDKKILKELGLYNKDLSKWKEDYLKENDLTRRIEDLSKNDGKQHLINEKKVNSMCLKYKTDNSARKASDVFKFMLDQSGINKDEYYLFITINLDKLKTVAVLFKNKKIIESLNYDYVASRGSEIIPKIEEILK